MSITNPTLSLADGANVLLTTGAVFNLNFSGTDTIRSLFFDGISQAVGTWGSLASTATNKSSFFIGTGVLNITTFVSPVLTGDYNNDGKVDADDYVAWRKDPAAFGGMPGGYNTWRANFGSTADTGASFAAVPEPSTCLLIVIGAFELAWICWPR